MRGIDGIPGLWWRGRCKSGVGHSPEI
jgi:hypothetical protein